MKANLKYSKKRLSEGLSPYASSFEDFVERVDEVSTKDGLEKLYDEVNAYGFNMSDLHYLTYLIFKKMKLLEESLNEDIHEESLKEKRKQIASNKKSFKNIKTINNIKIGDSVINSNRPKDYGVMEVLDIRQVDKEYRNQLGSLKETEVVLYSPKERRKFFIPQGEFIMNYRKECNESLNEDLFDKPRNIADSICKYLDSKNFYNYELVDYDAYPMNTSKITFEVDGDWKHDHWRFKDLVYDWSFDNNKSIYKMESELVRDDGSDSYASDYFIYVTENEDSLNALKSMSKLFSEEYEEESLSEGLDPWYGKYVPIDIGGSKGTPRKVYFYFDSTDFDEAEEEFFDIIPEPYVKAKLYGRASEHSLIRDGWKSINESLKESLGSADDCYKDFFNVLEQFYNKLSKKSKPGSKKALSQYYGSTPLYSHVGNDLSFDDSGDPVELIVGQAYEGEKTWKSGSTVHHYSVASDIGDALKNVVNKYNGKFFNGSTSTYMVDIDGYRIRCTNKYGSSYSTFLLYTPVKLTKA